VPFFGNSGAPEVKARKLWSFIAEVFSPGKKTFCGGTVLIARFHDRSILVDGGIIFGFDTPDVFDKNIDVLEKIRIDSVAVNILIPCPGTEFYRKLEREGRIICTDYTKYTGGTVIVRPKNMTVEQLQAGYNRVTKDYYRMMEIVYRAFKQPNAVATITRLIANVRRGVNCIP
jgi:uncharacterized radical SAM superfamily protein